MYFRVQNFSKLKHTLKEIPLILTLQAESRYYGKLFITREGEVPLLVLFITIAYMYQAQQVSLAAVFSVVT